MIIFKEEIKNYVENDQHKTDYEFAVELNRWFLQPLGLWPLNHKNSKLEILFSKISVIYSIFFLLFLSVPGCFEMLLIRDIETTLKKIGPLSFNITNALKYILFLFHQRKIGFCLQTVYIDWCNVKNEKDRAIMIKSTQTTRQFITICAVLTFSGLVSYCTIVPILENSASSGNHTVRNLPFPGYFLVFDLQTRPFYEVVFFIQFVCTLVTCSLTCGVCSLTILFVMHICGQLEIVMDLLRNLVHKNDSKENQTGDEKMAYIVECHLRSLRFAKQIEYIMNEICLVEFLNSIFGICLLGYYVMMESQRNNTTGVVVYIMVFGSYFFNIFTFSYISEKLKGQVHFMDKVSTIFIKTEKVGKVAYLIEWETIPAKEALNLILIILVSCRPEKLTGGNMITFSMESFCSVLKASAVYLNVICNFVK